MGVETSSIAANVERVHQRIAAAARRCGRRPEEITLVAVSKTFSAEGIREAYAVGVRHFGENRVQEWESKQPLLGHLDATWHLVGHLQSNKAARAARLFDAIDSLDSIELARKLDRVVGELARQSATSADRTRAASGRGLTCPEPAAAGRGSRAAEAVVQQGASAPEAPSAPLGTTNAMRLRVLLEVRLDPKETKSGVEEHDLPRLAEAVVALPHLELRGLMCIPPYSDDAEQVRRYFRKLREFCDALRQHLAWHAERSPAPRGAGRSEESPLPELSMGMSQDFEVAIEEGATQVRLGTAIFGPRND